MLFVVPPYPHALTRVRIAAVTAALLILVSAIVLPVAVARTSNLRSEPVLITLPEPTGPMEIGSLDMHLIDHDRIDPLAEDPGPRELMITIWYPAVHQQGKPATPYLSERVASFYDQTTGELGLESGDVDFAGIRSHAQTRAPIAADGPYPVLIYSPGGGNPRAFGTTQIEDLVSHGYLVVAVDSTNQAPIEFPDGTRMPAQHPDMQVQMVDRVNDISFVLDQLRLIADGGDPDVEGRELPAGFGAQFDLERVGMFGHSIGGFAAAETMQVDDRIDAGVNLDGSMVRKYRVGPETPIERPFMLIGGGTDGDSDRPHDHRGAPDWADYWRLLDGWKRDLYLPDAEHMSFNDLQSLLPAIDAEIPLDPDELEATIGTVDPALSLAVQRTYLRAFFDQHLLGVPQPALDRVPDELTTTAELIS